MRTVDGKKKYMYLNPTQYKLDYKKALLKNFNVRYVSDSNKTFKIQINSVFYFLK